MYPHAYRVARQRIFRAAPYPLRLSALAVTLSFSILPGHAQEPAVLPPVEVKGSYDESIGTWDAASQGAVTKEVIEKRPILRPAEVLENVPGHGGHAALGRRQGQPVLSARLQPRSRHRFRDVGSGHAGQHAHARARPGLHRSQLPHPGADHARGLLARGRTSPRTVTFPRRAARASTTPSGSPNGIASLTGGSFGYGRAVLAGSPEFGAGRLVYGLEYQHSDGPWDNPNRFHKTNGVLRYAQGTRAQRLQHHRHGLSRLVELDRPDSAARRRFRAHRALRRHRSHRRRRARSATACRASGGSPKAASNRAASVYLIRSRLNLFSNFTFFLDDPVNGDQFEQAEKRLVAGGSASQTWFLKSGERQIWNTLGAQVRRDRIEPVGLYSTVARERLATTRQDDVTVTSVAPYFSNTIAWTSWFRTIAGLRADYVDMDVASDNPVNSGKAHDFLWSPKLSLVFGPWSRTEYFANIGRGFHSNDARGTTITIDPKTGAPADRVDPLVQTFGYEGGVRSELAKGLTASAALWKPGAGFRALVRGRRRDHGAEPSVAALRARAPHAIPAEAGPRARPVAGVYARALPRRRPGGQLHTRRARPRRVGRRDAARADTAGSARCAGATSARGLSSRTTACARNRRRS